MHLDNWTPRPSGEPAAWFQLRGEELRGALTPFGAAVRFEPARTKGRVDKPLPTALYGGAPRVPLRPGGAWSGEYLVEGLDYFIGVGFVL